jgi:hypothetical protein
VDSEKGLGALSSNVGIDTFSRCWFAFDFLRADGCPNIAVEVDCIEDSRVS